MKQQETGVNLFSIDYRQIQSTLRVSVTEIEDYSTQPGQAIVQK